MCPIVVADAGLSDGGGLAGTPTGQVGFRNSDLEATLTKAEGSRLRKAATSEVGDARMVWTRRG